MDDFDFDGKELPFDLGELKNSLERVENAVSEEKRKSQGEPFDEFLTAYLNIEPDSKEGLKLKEQYFAIIEGLVSGEGTISDRIITFLDSEFLYSILTVSNLQYEREIRRFISSLISIITDASKEAHHNESRFIERVLHRGISSTSYIDSDARKSGELVKSIVQAFKAPIMAAMNGE